MAIAALRRRKATEQEFERLQDARLQLEIRINTLESANLDARTLLVMQGVNTQLYGTPTLTCLLPVLRLSYGLIIAGRPCIRRYAGSRCTIRIRRTICHYRRSLHLLSSRAWTGYVVCTARYKLIFLLYRGLMSRSCLGRVESRIGATRAGRALRTARRKWRNSECTDIFSPDS